MTQFIFKRFLFGSVLALGLVSCASENNGTSSAYQAPPPKIIRADKKTPDIDVREFEHSPVRTLDLQDQIDASAGQPTSLQVQVRCRQSSQQITEKITIPGPSFVIMQALPEALLSRDLNQVPLECNFMISLFNSKGSRHIFNLPNVFITDAAPKTVQVRRESFRGQSEPLSIRYGDLQDIRIRFENTEPAQAKISCEMIEFPSRDFSHSKDISEFNLFDYRVRTLEPYRPPKLNPLQFCRTLIFQNQRVVALSPRFELLLPQTPIVSTVTHTPRANHANLVAQTAPLLTSFIRNHEPLKLSEYVIHNPEAERRWIRLTKANGRTTLNLYFVAEIFGNRLMAGPYAGNRRKYWMKSSLTPSNFAYSAPDQQPVFEDENFKIYAIEGHGELKLVAQLINPEKLGCSSYQRPLGRPLALEIISIGTPPVLEVDFKAREIAQIQMAPVRTGLFSTSFEVTQDAPAISIAAPINFCSWP